MPVDLEWQRVEPFWRHPALVPGDCLRRVETFPIHKLSAPSEVGVLAIREECLVIKFAGDAYVVHHLTAVKGRRAGSPEDVLSLLILAGVWDISATIEVPEIGKEINAGRVNDLCLLRRFSGIPPQELAADCSHARVERA